MAIASPLTQMPQPSEEGETPVDVNVVPDDQAPDNPVEGVAPDDDPMQDQVPQRANLAEYMEEDDLASIANELIPLFDADQHRP